MWMAVLMSCLGDVLAETMKNLIICKIDMVSAFMAKTMSFRLSVRSAIFWPVHL